MNISFSDFWPGFQENNNFFINLLKATDSNYNVVPLSDKTEALIYSCFGSRHIRVDRSKIKKIFYTGENIRPNYRECDLSMSFDFDDYGGRNIRLPLWYLYIDWFNVNTYANPNWLIPTEYLAGENGFTQKEKVGFCATVFSSPHSSRFNMVDLLNNYKTVDCYGKIHQNKLPDGEKFKMDTISNYKFNICFENSIYPGYFTEKLLHAKIAGCIPIYYSDKSYVKDFNEKCCINLIDFKDETDLIEYIKEIDTNDDLYQSIRNEKLFNEEPNTSGLKIKELLCQ